MTFPNRKGLTTTNSEAKLISGLFLFVLQMVSSDGSPLSFLSAEAQAQASPPPPYPTPQELPQPLLQQPRTQESAVQQPQAASSLPQSDFQLLTAQVRPSRNTAQEGMIILSWVPSWMVPFLFPEGLIFDQLLPGYELRPAVHEARASLYSTGEWLPGPAPSQSKNCCSVCRTHTKQTGYSSFLNSDVLDS